MARPLLLPLLPLLGAAVALLLPCAAAAAARCRRPWQVPNARLETGNATELDACLRYACEPGYKRKAGTSSLTRCVLPPGAAEPAWTQPTLQCIRDPALPPLAPGSEPPRGAEPAPPAATAPEPASHAGATAAAATSPGSAPETSAPAAAPPPATRHPAVSTQIVLSSAGLPGLLAAAAVAGCCWRMKARARRRHVAPAAAAAPGPDEGAEMLPPAGAPPG